MSTEDLEGGSSGAVNIPLLQGKVEAVFKERMAALREFYNQRFDNIAQALRECLTEVDYDKMVGVLKHSSRNNPQIYERIAELVQNRLAAERELQIDQLSKDLTLLNGINQRLEDELSRASGG